MELNIRIMNCGTHLLSGLLAACLLASCSQTSSPAPNQTAQAPAVQAPPPPMTTMQPSQPGAAGGQCEEPPVVTVADLLPGAPLSGPGYTVQPQAPTNGAMGQYTIVADPSVFHDDAGTYYVESLDMLKIRGKAAGQAGNATLTDLGYDQMRRQLAHKLHVDPYSSDPILTKKLNHAAWVMFSARMTVDAAMMAVPGSMIISGVEITKRSRLSDAESRPHYSGAKEVEELWSFAGRDRGL